MHGQFTKEKIELWFKSSSQGQVHKNQHAGMTPYERTNQIHSMCVHQRKTDALNTEMGEKNLVSSENRINFRFMQAGVCRHSQLSVFLRCLQPSSPRLSCCVSIFLALFFSLLLCPPHIICLPILPLRLPQRPQIPSFCIYLQMRLLSCHLFRSPSSAFSPFWWRQQIPLFCSFFFFFRYKLVKTKEILKSHVFFWFHPPFSVQTFGTCFQKPHWAPLFHCCLSRPNVEKHKMPISHHSGWEKKSIHQQWKTFTDTFTAS